MEERRKLKLLPEVLPAPNRNRNDAGPRARTRDHMQRLLAAAAITGALACRSDPGYGVVDPMPAPADASGPPPPPAPADATAPPPPPMGYAVVDPMPMPAGRDAGALPKSDASGRTGDGSAK